MIITFCVVSSILLVCIFVGIRDSRARRIEKHKDIIISAMQGLSAKVLPADILAKVNESGEVSVDQRELIHLLDQLVEDGLVQRNDLSPFDRAQLARKSLKGEISRTTGYPIVAMGVAARFSLTREGLQQAA
jgi:hypothetical protein